MIKSSYDALKKSTGSSKDKKLEVCNMINN